MNNNDFMLAADGWVQVSPLGDFKHAGAGVVQVIDRAACDRIAADFNGRKADTNFPGVLVDFDHFSLDTEKSSEAAGWISDLESRDTGLWARVRWSDAGLAAVQGGRFRLMNPVFPPPSACEDLGGGKIRPVMLVSVALANEPNIKGGKPIANRRAEIRRRRSEIRGRRSERKRLTTQMQSENAQRSTLKEGETEGSNTNEGELSTLNIVNREARRGKDETKGDVLSGPGAKRFMWLLGETKTGEHCPVCLARSGQVKTLLEWLKAGPPPCRCKCQLAEVGGQREEIGGQRTEDADVGVNCAITQTIDR